MKRKALTEATDAELEKLLEGNDSPDLFEPSLYHNDMLEFISAYRLKNGDHPVTTKLLYQLYLKWSERPLKPRAFTISMGNFIPYVNNRFFYINLNDQQILKRTFNFLKKTRTENKIKAYKIHYENFLKKYDIKTGTFAVKTPVLYNLYDKWAYEIKRGRPLGYRVFLNFCKLYFNNKRIVHNYWFYVDKSIIKHFSEEMIRAMKNKKVTRYGQKENKKKPGKISGSRSKT